MSDRYAQVVNAPLGSDRSPSRSACRSRSSSSATRPARRSSPARSSPAPPRAGGSSKHARAPSSTQIGVERGRRPRARSRRSSSTPPGSPTRPSWSSCSASSTPAVGRLARCGRVVVLGTAAERGRLDPGAATAQRALEGFTRSLGKEIGGRGSTAQLVYVAPGAEEAARLDPALPALAALGLRLRPGRPGRHRRSPTPPELDWERPLDGQGGAGHRRLARDRRGDRRDPRPRRRRASSASTCRPLADDLRAVAGAARRPRRSSSTSPPRTRRRGSPTASPTGVDVVVHNAGVTRDRTIAKMPEERWTHADGDQPLQRGADQRRRCSSASLLRRQRPHRLRLLDVRGSPATPARPTTRPRRPGVIGMVEAMAPELAERGATINAVAPGFIETQMTAAMPIGPREAGRRLSSLSPGRPAGRRRRDDRLVREPGLDRRQRQRRSASAARACWGRDDGDAHPREPAQHPAALRARGGADDPRRLAAALHPGRRRRDPRARPRAGRRPGRPRARSPPTPGSAASPCATTSPPPTRTCSPSRCRWR